jgi:hypothetical protein
MLFSAIANAVGAPLGGMLLDLDGLLGSTRVGPPNRARKRRYVGPALVGASAR